MQQLGKGARSPSPLAYDPESRGRGIEYSDVVRCRDIVNGDETVVIEQDGVVASTMHNGRPCVTRV